MSQLERYETQLQENVNKLETSLRQWQRWDLEYESLKEVVEELPSPGTHDALLHLKASFERDQLTEKEVDELLGLSTSTVRSTPEILSLIDRRLDYVQTSITSLQKQITAATEKLEKVKVVAEDVADRGGLPVAEIHEELDEDGNVVSSHVSNPAESGLNLLETLKKAGFNEKDFLRPHDDDRDSAIEEDISRPTTQSQPTTEATSSASHPASSANKAERKKSVSFADGTSPGDDAAIIPAASQHTTTDLAKGSFGEHDRVVQLNDDDEIIGVNDYVMPEGDSPEDAALRRELIQYSMNEVGSIVAQMDLDDIPSDESGEDDSDEMSITSATDDEDDHGMSRRSNLNDDYRREMQELEKRLNMQMMENLGPRPEVLADEVDRAQGAHRILVRSEVDPDGASEATTRNDTQSTQKSVRFAEDLHIAPTTAPHEQPTALPPLADTIVERPARRPEEQRQQPPKVSRFKSARSQEAPTGPPDRIIADTVVERPSASSQRPPAEEDELDSNLHRRQVANEYYAQRNKLINRQGGFSQQLDEQEDDQPERKVSMFKAARVKDGAWK